MRWINDNKKSEWRELIDQLDKSIAAMRYAFSNSSVIVANDPSHDPGIGIFNGNRAIQDKIFILEALRKNGLIEEWTKLVNYISEIGNPREPSQRGGLTYLYDQDGHAMTEVNTSGNWNRVEIFV